MRIAYADPPYLGQSRHYPEHPEAERWDSPGRHAILLDDLQRGYDGWAYSLSSPSLLALSQFAPAGARVGAWTKTFASFKPGVSPAYAWEPVFFKPARTAQRDEPTVRDWVSAPITLQRGTHGAKPDAFCFWLFELLGARPEDEFVDLFPGSGAVTRAWEQWSRQLRMA